MSQAGFFIRIWVSLKGKLTTPKPGSPLSFFSRSSCLRRVPLALAPQFLENSHTLIAAASGPGAAGFKLGNKPSDGKGRSICHE